MLQLSGQILAKCELKGQTGYNYGVSSLALGFKISVLIRLSNVSNDTYQECKVLLQVTVGEGASLRFLNRVGVLIHIYEPIPV